MSGFKSGIKISLSAKKPESPAASLNATVKSKKTPTVAAVFNDSDDSEPEEMPAEARIRMRNIGKHTPTSAGPNSYGKTNRGFTDRRAEIEKQLRQQLEKASDDADQQPKRKSSSNSEASGDSRRNSSVDHQKSNDDTQQPPSKRSRSFGDDHEDAGGGVKILPLKDSFSDIVQDVRAEDDEANDS